MAVTLAFVGTVLSETVAANRGIGTVMMMATSSFDVPLAFAGLFALAILGILLYAVFALTEQRVCGWANHKQNSLWADRRAPCKMFPPAAPKLVSRRTATAKRVLENSSIPDTTAEYHWDGRLITKVH